MQIRMAPSCRRARVPTEIVPAVVSNRSSAETREWASSVLSLVDEPCGVVIAVSELGLGPDRAWELTRGLARAIGAQARETSGLANLALGTPRSRTWRISAGQTTRHLLPHHDSPDRSYLTPSLLDMPTFDPALRVFSTPALSTNCTLYAGFWVEDPGDQLSITAFYDWVRVLRDAHTYATGRSAAMHEVERWLGGNLRKSYEARDEHGSQFLSFGGALGVADLALHVWTVEAEKGFTPAALARLPRLKEYARACPCRTCATPGSRLVCHSCTAALGLSWPEFRARYETCVSSRQFDFVLSNNVRTCHGGLAAGRGRRLWSLCLGVRTPAGPAFEGWLAREWRVGWAGRSPAEAQPRPISAQLAAVP